MNDLILLLWLADFSHSITGILCFVLLLTILAILTAAIFYFMFSSEITRAKGSTVYNQAEIEEMESNRNLMTRTLKYALITAITSSVLISVIPSKTTIHAIAGIKAAELAIDSVKDSQLFDKTMTLIESKIDEELKKTEKETK